MKPLPSHVELRERLKYDPDTGVFLWTGRGCKRLNHCLIGRPAGSLTPNGYIGIELGHGRFAAHRLAWKYVHGADPTGEIDHINGDRTDNRIANLRDTSRAENARNMCLPSHNKSGVIGVCFKQDRGKWMASIKINRRIHYLGNFHDKADAIAARKAAEARFRFHPNHGRPANGMPASPALSPELVLGSADRVG